MDWSYVKVTGRGDELRDPSDGEEAKATMMGSAPPWDSTFVKARGHSDGFRDLSCVKAGGHGNGLRDSSAGEEAKAMVMGSASPKDFVLRPKATAMGSGVPVVVGRWRPRHWAQHLGGT